jgi:hypothetical protein
MDGVFLFSEEGSTFAAWIKEPRIGSSGRIEKWIADWRMEQGAAIENQLGGSD